MRLERIVASAFGVDDGSSRRLASVSIFVSSSTEGLPIRDVAKSRQIVERWIGSDKGILGPRGRDGYLGRDGSSRNEIDRYPHELGI